ncbi:hypothetical protein Q2389_26475, partial [Escherichia coli]|nr:hypothetical protein [Escherichia coli]
RKAAYGMRANVVGSEMCKRAGSGPGGVCGAAGLSPVDLRDEDGPRAGAVGDDAGSLGGSLNLIQNASELWADIGARGTRHSMKA